MDTLASLENKLYYAILANNLDNVAQILSQGANPNKTIKHGRTCLGEAAGLGNTAIVKMLIDHSKVFMEKNINYHKALKKKHNIRTMNKRKMRNDGLDIEPITRRKSLSDGAYYAKKRSSMNEETCPKTKNQGYFVLIHSDGSSSDDSKVSSLRSPASSTSLPSLTSSPEEDLQWDEDIGNPAPSTSEDETWSSMYQWYASILETTGAAIESASAVTNGIDQQDAFMRTALHYASERGHVEVVKLLINAGCRLDITACNGVTPLHTAVMWDNADVVQALVTAGTQVNYNTHDKGTPLHLAVARRNFEVVNILVKGGASLEVRDGNECTPLHLAVSLGDLDMVNYLISFGADVNGEEIHGYTPLQEAVKRKCARIVDVLLKAGARITHSHQLLHIAVQNQQEEIVRMLADAGGGINLPDCNGDTPLLLAARWVLPDVSRILLERGANVNAYNSITGANALHIAVECADDADAFVRLLACYLRHGIDMDATALTGDTALFRALLLKQDELAAILIQHGADVNMGDDIACGLDNLSIASRLTTHHLANMLVKAGHHLPPPDPNPVPSHLEDTAASWVHEICRHPLSLSDIARIAIRKQRRNITMFEYIDSLPLPTRMKRYLMLEDEYI